VSQKKLLVLLFISSVILSVSTPHSPAESKALKALPKRLSTAAPATPDRARVDAGGDLGSVTLTISKTEYSMVEPVVVTVRLENHVEQKLIVWFDDRDMQIGKNLWTLLDHLGEPVRKTIYGRGRRSGNRGMVSIPAQETKEIQVLLNRYFDLSKPGEYSLKLEQVIFSVFENNDRRERMDTELKKFVVKDGIHRPAARARGATAITVEGDVLDGFRLTYSLDKREFATSEAIDLDLNVTRIDGPTQATTSDDPAPVVSYVLELENVSTRYNTALTRFGKSRPICLHKARQGLRVAEKHEDSIVLNQFFDLTKDATYRLKVRAEIKSPSGPEHTILTAPDAEIVVGTQPKTTAKSNR